METIFDKKNNPEMSWPKLYYRLKVIYAANW